MKRFLMIFSIAAVMANAGALMLEVASPDANPEAKALNAMAVARVTACHDPAKSRVTASMVRFTDGKIQRTKLDVVPLASGGTFAIVGSVPADTAAIELAVTNPEYQNYEPRVLISRDAGGVQWASLKRFFGTPPTPADVKAVLE